ncbi:MAG: TA system VapC family ribonuclease toxin [Sporichthyaceae bacterium]
MRDDAPDHSPYRTWLEEAVAGSPPFGLSTLVLSGTTRVLTHPRIFDPPSGPEQVMDRLDELRARPNAVPIAPGPRHWAIFGELVRTVGACGTVVPDAYFAALAIESGSEWITADRGFGRFPGLRWRHPLD